MPLDCRVVTVIGVLGQRWRAEVTPGGVVVPLDGSAPTSWRVAAEDRWHDPASESGVRQVLLEGTPVVETRLRVPGGDVITRIGAVPDHGGLTVFEFTNDSPAAVAVALSGGAILAPRTTSAVPGPGASPDPDAVVVPLGHRARTTVVVAQDPTRCERYPEDLVDLDAVARGWIRTADEVSRVVVAGDPVGDDLRRMRCQRALTPFDPTIEPVAALAHLVEILAMGEPWSRWSDEFAALVAMVIRSARPRRGWTGRTRNHVAPAGSHGVLMRARAVLGAVGEQRGAEDLDGVLTGLAPSAPARDSEALETIAIEERFARAHPLGASLMPDGLDAAWFGASLEAHGLPAGGGGRLSFALRWHGERPALLWEITGGSEDREWRLDGGGLDPTWSSTHRRGEALLGVPPGADQRRRDLNSDGSPDPATTAPVVSMLPPPRRR